MDDAVFNDSLKEVRQAIKTLTGGNIYDAKGFLTQEGYKALETIEGLDLFWICDPLIKLARLNNE